MAIHAEVPDDRRRAGRRRGAPLAALLVVVVLVVALVLVVRRGDGGEHAQFATTTTATDPAAQEPFVAMVGWWSVLAGDRGSMPPTAWPVGLELTAGGDVRVTSICGGASGRWSHDDETVIITLADENPQACLSPDTDVRLLFLRHLAQPLRVVPVAGPGPDRIELRSGGLFVLLEARPSDPVVAETAGIEMRVDESLIAGAHIDADLVVPSAAGQPIEVTLTSGDGCGGMGVGAGTVGADGRASIELAVPPFVVRSLCPGGPATVTLTGTTVDLAIHRQHSSRVLHTARFFVDRPVTGVGYRSALVVTPPCGGVPHLGLGDTSWRAMALGSAADGVAQGAGVAGTVTLHSAASATFVAANGAVVALVPAEPGDVEYC